MTLHDPICEFRLARISAWLKCQVGSVCGNKICYRGITKYSTWLQIFLQIEDSWAISSYFSSTDKISGFSVLLFPDVQVSNTRFGMEMPFYNLIIGCLVSSKETSKLNFYSYVWPFYILWIESKSRALSLNHKYLLYSHIR